jgi:hypothetical protein
MARIPEVMASIVKFLRRIFRRYERNSRSSELASPIQNLPPPEDLEVKKKLENLEMKDCNPQLHSPLFNKIPPEIRNHIFDLAVAETNGKRAIARDAFWYRPDFTHHTYVDTALLRTCRLIYLETRALPTLNVTLRFWVGDPSRCPLQGKLLDDVLRLAANIT